MKQFKKVLAFVLALAMVVTAVPTADAKAAAKQPKLNNTKKILYVGQSYTLKIGNLPANWKKCTYAWSASNKNVTVKKGKYGQAASVKANKAGTATVTVKMTYPQTAAQKKAKKKTVKTFKCAVTVKNPSVKFTTTADRIEVGETAQFTAKAAPSTAKVTYSSSDAAVATVDANGLVTAVADGTATIKASIKVGNVTKTASKTVEVYTAPTEAKQTKVKEITITSGKVVTKDSKIEVKKGSVEVAPAEKKDGSKDIAIDATGKTVVITTAAKLTKGEYTVTIDGVTANFTAEDERVDKIEFSGDKAVLDSQVCDQCFSKTSCGSNHDKRKIYKTAKVGYKVYNQFNEDITDATSVKLSGSDVTAQTPAKKGEVEFTSKSLDGYRLNDIVAAVVIYNQNGVAVTKAGTFTISNEAAISEISIKDGVYNKKGEAVTLTEDTNLAKEKLYVLVAAKDQYGNTKTSLTNNDNVMVQMAGGLTNLTLYGATPTSEEITVDGVKYAGFRLDKTPTEAIGAGTATLIIISKGTGVTAQGTITVANGGKVDTITIQAPDLIVAGEDNKLGYTALDSYGKEVTKLSSLTDITNVLTEAQAKTAGKGIFAKENPATGKAELYYKAASKPATGDWDPTAVIDYDTVSLITKTYKSTAVNFSIKPNAQPTSIVGTKDLTTGAIVGQQFTVLKDNIKVADQYGRTDKLSIDNYKIYAYFPDAKAGNNAFDTADATYTVFNGLNNKKGEITEAVEISKKVGTSATAAQKADAYITDNDKDPITVVRFVLAPSTVTTAAKLAPTENDGKNVLSTYDVTFTSTTDANVKTYEVADIGTVYAGAKNDAYNKDLDVKGVSSDGTKVAIPASKYEVEVKGVTDDANDFKIIPKASDVTIKQIQTSDLTDAGDTLDKTKDKATAEITLTFTFEDGQSIEKKVTISRETPQVKEVKIKNGKDALEILTDTTAADNVTFATDVETGVKAVKVAVNGLTDGTDDGIVKTTVEAELANITDAKVKAEVTKRVAAVSSSKTVVAAQAAAATAATDDKTAATTAEGTALEVGATQIYTAITKQVLIEAKDQYGVDIAATAAPRVTVSEAKDAAGNDVRTNGNGKPDTKFALGTVKAKVTLTFDGGYVFTANVVLK